MYIRIAFWALVIGVFFYLWWKGHLLRISAYVLETREELRKCTWPTVDELKGSTLVVMITIALLGCFTVLVDLVFGQTIQMIL